MAAPHLVPQPIGGAWDEVLYGTLLKDGYSQQQLGHTQRSAQVTSEPYVRRYTSHRPIRMVVGVEQTALQWKAFEGFWESTLVWGAKWFKLDLVQVDGTVVAYTVNLTGWTVKTIENSILSLTRLEMDLEALRLDPVP